MPLVKPPVVLLPLVLDCVTPDSGPWTRTVLVSIWLALAAINGVTVTVFCARLTMLDAARLNSRLRRAELLRAMLRPLLGSRYSVSVTWPNACPLAPKGVSATPSMLPSS